MVAEKERKYYMLCGKDRKRVRFVNHGHPTMVVSTDSAHSLSDSFAQVASGSRWTEDVFKSGCSGGGRGRLAGGSGGVKMVCEDGLRSEGREKKRKPVMKEREEE
ncbi:hypothetical protein PIB30_030278 [Stylosanthes scabra]|uniref:Uncharacterized protein n=1 Tax=Stylosanthes scabra TaxID=79078 RepID=A0ABU6Z968_9FABA|nr:hypothetical protein [Stylosanthes scabra]